MVIVLVVFALVAGLAIGWLWARHGTDESLRRASSDLARLGAALEIERRAAGEREHRLRDTFGALSAEALQRSSESLLQLAEQRLATSATAASGDLAQRQQAIESLVAPLRTQLDQVHEQLRSVERGRAMSDSALREQIDGMRQSSDRLRTETGHLVNSLRAPHVRGRWGELQLQRTVEAAGLQEHVDYTTQLSVTDDEDGTQRPDLVVHLVGGKNVVVDAKVAFSAYLEAMEARDDARRANRLKAHARQLREHVDALAAKSYWQRFAPSPEFVVCFIPADAFLDAALREEPGLLEHAFARNVVLATPSTLIALLRTVAYTWRQDALAANAAAVHRLGRELYQRLSTMGDHLDKLGRTLNQAVGSYNRTVSSLEGRVLVTARKMTDLQVVAPDSELRPPEQVTSTARSAQAPELADLRLVTLATARSVQPVGYDRDDGADIDDDATPGATGA